MSESIDLKLHSEQDIIWGHILKNLQSEEKPELNTEIVGGVFMQIQTLVIQELSRRGTLQCEKETECFDQYSKSGLSQKFRERWGEPIDLAYPEKAPTLGQYVVYLIRTQKQQEALNLLLSRL